MTIYDFARKCMTDPEFNCGGIPKNERKYLDDIGFEYTMKDGCVWSYGEDLNDFYDAMFKLQRLNKKYNINAE